jgi:hypothetical protein
VAAKRRLRPSSNLVPWLLRPCTAYRWQTLPYLSAA